MLKYSMFKDFAPLQEELNLRVETENARRRLTGLPLLPKVSAEKFFEMVLLAYELDTLMMQTTAYLTKFGKF